ncbi:hypothetical protein [Roseivirga thermotolerans]|uniref:Uncharacterized protein n=1 Tax=Roseivirga thermotolerans TaxID=1758176 RepID=A0ABQ3IBM6_9BACT|nr:hypothetical protein [Roseivirga thermotolerans]GHE67673.1 hypothetical protein GCM10011340_24050 [Roseivirga thermotolerans]
MPTIEIVSINSKQLNINQFNFKLAIREEHKLESDRGLFYDFLLKNEGTILHLGNPEFVEGSKGGFFAGELINWDYEPKNIVIPHVEDQLRGANQQVRFQFLPEFKDQIDQLLNIALRNSPVSKVFFLTDYQFGPYKANYEQNFLINDLWEQHDSNGLIWNTLYEIYGK